MLDPISRRLFSAGSGSAPQGAVALVYHSIAQSKAGLASPYSVTLDNFRRQLDLMGAHGWRVRALTHAVAAAPAPRTAVITFDDGYADNVALALPELLARGFCAAFFVVTRALGMRTPVPALGVQAQAMMSAAEVRTLLAQGMEVGAHSRTHQRLSRLAPAAQHDEIAGSKADLEALTGVEASCFAYPYGDLNDQVREQVAQAGFRYAVTTSPQRIRAAADTQADPLRIGRVTIMRDDSLSSFARKLAFADTDVGWPRLTGYIVKRFRQRWL